MKPQVRSAFSAVFRSSVIDFVRHIGNLIRHYWLPLICVFLLSYLLDAYSNFWVVFVIKSLLYVIAAAGLFGSVYFRARALRRWGGEVSPEVLSELARLQVGSVGFLLGEVASVLMETGFLATGSAILLGGGWLSFGLMIFATGLSMTSRFSTPPLVAFFATSRAESERLASELTRGLLQDRVVNLLAPPNVDPGEPGVLGESYRALTDAKWRESVKSLMGLSRIIVLDCRDSTSSLAYEAGIILTSSLVGKTIFLGDGQGQCRALSPVIIDGNVSPNISVNVLSESQLLPALRKIAECPAGIIFSELLPGALRTVGDAAFGLSVKGP
jgi:hypothetical protein